MNGAPVWTMGMDNGALREPIDPALLGSASLEPCGAFEAGSHQSFTLVYTAGRSTRPCSASIAPCATPPATWSPGTRITSARRAQSRLDAGQRRPRRRSPRVLARAMGAGGCHSCHSHGACTEHCPVGLSPMASIAGLKRTALGALLRSSRA